MARRSFVFSVHRATYFIPGTYISVKQRRQAFRARGWDEGVPRKHKTARASENNRQLKNRAESCWYGEETRNGETCTFFLLSSLFLFFYFGRMKRRCIFFNSRRMMVPITRCAAQRVIQLRSFSFLPRRAANKRRAANFHCVFI